MKPNKKIIIPEFTIEPEVVYIVKNEDSKELFAYGKDMSFDGDCLVCKRTFFKSKIIRDTLRHGKRSYLFGKCLSYRQDRYGNGKFRTNYYNIEPEYDQEWPKLNREQAVKEIDRLVCEDNDTFMEELSKRSIVVQMWYLGTTGALKLQFKKYTDVIMYMNLLK